MAEQMMQDVAGKAIPAGYQQTEVGVIPEDWSVEALSQVAQITRGKFSARPRNDPKFFGGNIPFIQTGDITRSNGYDVKFSQTINEIGLSVSRLFPAGSLFFTIAANIGDVAIVKYPAACPDSLVVIKENEHINKRWLYHILLSKKESFESIATSNAQLNINLEKLNPYILGVPALEEQTAIANVLSDSDALIGAMEQLIAKKQAIKTATMQQLLTGRTRLPQFALRPDGTRKGYKSSELGQIPEDWDVVCAGDLGKFRGGNGFPVIEQGKLNGEYPFYKVSDMNNEGNDVYMSVSNNWISKEDQSRIGSFVFPSGCIVFAKVGAAVFLERKKILSMPSCIDNNMAALELNIAKCDVSFVYHFLQSIRFGDFVSTTALPSLNASVLSKIKIIMPLIKEQTAIATILSDMDNELQALTQKLEKARALKQGMMQQLLTGRTRLPLPQGA